MEQKLKDCNNHCGNQIYLSDQSGRWLPYNPDGTLHKCKDIQKTQTRGYNQQQTSSFAPASQQPQVNNALSEKQFSELKEILANMSILNSTRLEEIHKDVKGRGIPSDMFDDVIGTLQTHSEDLRQIKIKLGIIEQT